MITKRVGFAPNHDLRVDVVRVWRKARDGAGGGTRTRTGSVLSGLALPLAYTGRIKYRLPLRWSVDVHGDRAAAGPREDREIRLAAGIRLAMDGTLRNVDEIALARVEGAPGELHVERALQ